MLRVIDSYAQTDEDTTHVAVVDTTPPKLSLSLSPATALAAEPQARAITATIATSDVCDANPTVKLVSITSNEPDNGLGDGDTARRHPGRRVGTDDRTFQLRPSGAAPARAASTRSPTRRPQRQRDRKQATVTVPH